MLHFRYSVVALVGVIALLCFLSYLTLNPLKKSTMTEKKNKPSVARYMLWNSAPVAGNNTYVESRSPALRNSSIWNVLDNFVVTNDAKSRLDSANYSSSFSQLESLHLRDKNNVIPKSYSFSTKDQKVTLEETYQSDQVLTNKLNETLISDNISSNVKVMRNANIATVNHNEENILQNRIQIKYNLSPINQLTKSKQNIHPVTVEEEKQVLMSKTNKLTTLEAWNPNLWVDQHLNCTPQKNIMFFKTHKCATSTVQNVIFRYGDKHQLRFVLPNTKDHRFSLKQPFDRSQVLTRTGKTWSSETFNIFTNHAIFNKDEIEAVMPSDTIYISILRNPIAMYESLFTYLRLDLRYSADGGKHLVSMEEFLDNAPRFYRNHDQVYGGRYSRNPMLYDFGLPPEDMDNELKIDNLISIIDNRFDFIMIADYFQESLIMLKTLLCLELRDIAYLTFNARSADSVHTVSDSLAKKIRNWNWGDVRLFHHFNKTFHKKLMAFGGKHIKREKRKLEKMNYRVKEQCVADVVVDMESVWHPKGVKIEGFKLKQDQQRHENGICKMMTRPEKIYTDILKQRQSN